MRPSERGARIYCSLVMFANSVVLISYYTLDTWQLLVLLVGAGAILTPLARPGRFWRVAGTVISMATTLVWSVVGWPTATVAGLAWIAILWWYTLPGRDGMTPDHRSRVL